MTLPDGSLLLAVADGLGGHAGGEVASRTALDALVERLRAQPRPTRPSACATPSRRRTAPCGTGSRERTRGWARRSSPRSSAAPAPGRRTSATAAPTSCPSPTAAARRLTEDHSWVEEQIRAGLLEPDDPLAALNRHVITRAIGLDEEAGTDVTGPIALPERCLLLLSSDGLHGVLGDEEIGRIVAESGDGYDSELIDAVLERGAPDNVAIALYVHEVSGEAAS